MVRIGAAGSVTLLTCESAFFAIDAINARSKVLSLNVGFKDMIQKTLQNEGVMGIFKGYNASFYYGIIVGYLYFFIYKGVKKEAWERMNPETATQKAIVFGMASALAELTTFAI